MNLRVLRISTRVALMPQPLGPISKATIPQRTSVAIAALLAAMAFAAVAVAFITPQKFAFFAPRPLLSL
jgi:hypothetical protein